MAICFVAYNAILNMSGNGMHVSLFVRFPNDLLCDLRCVRGCLAFGVFFNCHSIPLVVIPVKIASSLIVIVGFSLIALRMFSLVFSLVFSH